jgi:hypothetical protein
LCSYGDNNTYSRVRQDVQKIFGEDFRVWQWLPEIPWSPGSSPLPGPASPASHSTTIPSSSSNPWPHVPTTQGVVGWQGCAFPLGKHVAAPLAPPTSCLKVRHMFDVLQQVSVSTDTQEAIMLLLRALVG